MASSSAKALPDDAVGKAAQILKEVSMASSSAKALPVRHAVSLGNLGHVSMASSSAKALPGGSRPSKQVGCGFNGLLIGQGTAGRGR